MSTRNLLYKTRYEINDTISVVIPTVGEILDNQDEYYRLVSILTAMPIDMMVQLDDIGVDFSTINEYDLFLRLFGSLQESDTSLIFGELDLSRFKYAKNKKNGMTVLVDMEREIVIDRAIHGLISSALREIHHIEKDIRKPANEETRKYMIRRAREKMMRRSNKKESSQIESLIIAMVNTEQYKYDFEGTRELSIYQFNESVRQIIKKIDYDNRMLGVYTGNINAKELSRNDLTWLKI